MSARVGVVLAAGLGSRLREDEGGMPKPLVPIAGVPLLFRALRSVRLAGCDRVVVVVGFRATEIVAALEHWSGLPQVTTVLNERYDLGNGVSLLAAAPHVGEEFMVTMADHVFDDGLMRLAEAHRPVSRGATLLVDHRIEEIFDLDDATKVRTGPNGRLLAIGKQLEDYDCIDTGVFIATRGLLHALASVREVRGDVSLSEGVAALASRGRMHTLGIGDLFWQDVDTPQMRVHADSRISR